MSPIKRSNLFLVSLWQQQHSFSQLQHRPTLQSSTTVRRRRTRSRATGRWRTPLRRRPSSADPRRSTEPETACSRPRTSPPTWSSPTTTASTSRPEKRTTRPRSVTRLVFSFQSMLFSIVQHQQIYETYIEQMLSHFGLVYNLYSVYETRHCFV